MQFVPIGLRGSNRFNGGTIDLMGVPIGFRLCLIVPHCVERNEPTDPPHFSEIPALCRCHGHVSSCVKLTNFMADVPDTVEDCFDTHL